MITFIPTREKVEAVFGSDTIYLDDSFGDSMCKKYNRGIDMLGDYEGWVCFRHDDTEIKTPPDVVESRLAQAYRNDQLVAGVIGTFNLDYMMHWWYPDREINGVGYILQKVLGPDEKPVVPEKYYEMRDWPGYHTGVATVDGCCIWIHTDALKKIRFDESIRGYHFYDVDICLQALRNKIGVCTIPVTVVHESKGKLPKNIDELRKPVFEKWAAIVNTFPINRFSIFRSDDEVEISRLYTGKQEDGREAVSDSAQG